MLILGGDYHPGFQQIVFVDTETGELEERRLTHGEEAEQFIKNSSSETKPSKIEIHLNMRGTIPSNILSPDLSYDSQ